MVAAITAVVALAPAGEPLLLMLAILVPLGVLYVVASVAAFLLRKLVPDCLILGPDHQTMLGELKREQDARAPNVLDMSADRNHALDRRVAVAVGVLLDQRA